MGYMPKTEKERKTMKKLIASVLLGAMLLGGTGSAIAADVSMADDLVLTEGSHLVLDRDSGYVDKIDGIITVGELKANFEGGVSICGKDGTAKTDDAVVATDDTVASGDVSLKALIYGDVTRDGKVNLADVSSMLKAIAKWEVSINTDAADVDKTGKLSLADVSKMLKYIAKWDDISLGNVRWVFENNKMTAENEDDTLDLFFETPLRKVGRSETESTGEHSYKIKLARRETESCQFFLTATEDKEGLTAELTEFVHEYGEGTLSAEILREYYYDLAIFDNVVPNWDHTTARYDYFAEPLLPNDVPFEVMADSSQGFMVNVTTDENTPAGMYVSTLNIKDADGNIVKTAQLYVYVWDFTLPVGTYSASAFGINRGSIMGYGSSPEYATPEEQYTVYYEKLLEYNMTPSELPYDILDDRSDAYMSDPRVTSFRTMPELGGYAYTDFFGEGNIGAVGEQNKNWDVKATEQKLVATMEKVSSDPVWAYKSYFTIMDEPYDLDAYNRIKNVDDWMKGLLGDIDFNLMLCMAHNGIYSDAPFVDLAEFVQPYLDMWCPQINAYCDYYNISTKGKQAWQTRRSYNTYGLYKDRLETSLMDEGDRAWMYICCSPEAPYANYFNTYHGVPVRMVLWQQYMFDVEGLLYWDTTSYWGNFSKHVYGGGNGDGLLMYPGNFYGYKGLPIVSYRMVQIRDSFDDYDYMVIAEEIAGSEAVDKIIHTVTTAALDYTGDPAVMEAARDALAKLIVNG